jgi:copper chaperone CopZ
VDKTLFDVPRMFADHHVQVVRNALQQLPGVQEVVASSAFKQVVVAYDPQRLDPNTIAAALRAAGYAPGEEWPLPNIPEGKDDSSSWWRTIQRITQTNPKDLEMSGDFRKY